MNFIGEIDNTHIEVELKYCERCGGIFLRPKGHTVAYCTTCARCLTAKPEAAEAFAPSTARKKRGPRMVKGSDPRDRQIEGIAKIDYLQGVAVTEVGAC